MLIDVLVPIFAPKILFNEIKIVEIVVFLASCLFNDDIVTILHVFQLLDIVLQLGQIYIIIACKRTRNASASPKTARSI